jgi:hypothetical protein
MIKDYSDNVPRPVKIGHCQIMDADGNLCNKPAEFEVILFGGENHNLGCWAVIKVCEKCAIEYSLEYKEYTGN